MQRTNMLMPLTLAVALVAGCATDKSYKGRVGTNQTTTYEIDDPRVQITALTEASDEVAQAFAKDLSLMEEVVAINAAGNRATVIMGDINNRTQRVGSDDFEMMRARVRNTLLQSSYVKDKVRFVERRGRIGRIGAEELGPQEDGSTYVPPSYDAKTTFTMNGDLYEVARPEARQFYMELQLVSYRSGTIVFSKRYEVKQLRIDRGDQ